MASLTTDPNGHKRIGIETPDGKRCTIRLGKLPDNTAVDYRDNIEHLRANWNTPHLIAPKILDWANKLDATIYERIARTGLLPSREPVTAQVVTLKAFLADVFATAQVKPGTLVFYGHTRRCLLKYFGEDRDIAGIGAKDADAFHAWLAQHDFAEDGADKPRRLSPATVSRRLLLARHTFHKAIRWGHLAINPFAGIRVGRQVNPSRKVYVPREDVLKVVDMATDAQFKLMLALSRFGGLRCPSEHLALRWDDVDWEHNRITVRSCKTEHHIGGESRMIPLFADLRPHLLKVFEEAEEGAEYVITAWRSPDKNLRTRLLKSVKRAGLKPWPKLFHNLRASCETDLAREYPLGTVAEWLGHNPAVMVTNYLTNPDLDADFKRASEAAASTKAKATRNPTRTGVNLCEFEGIQEKAEVSKTAENTAFSGVFGSGSMGDTGFEPVTSCVSCMRSNQLS
jgi:integrase